MERYLKEEKGYNTIPFATAKSWRSLMEGPREVLGAQFAFRGDMGEGGCAT